MEFVDELKYVSIGPAAVTKSYERVSPKPKLKLEWFPQDLPNAVANRWIDPFEGAVSLMVHTLFRDVLS
jgi:hypothetical protein